MPTPNSKPPHRFLIMAREVLVGHDIAGAILAAQSDAQVIRATTLCEAQAALSDLPALSVAFLQCAPANLQGTALANSIARCGGRVVFVGEEPPAGTDPILPTPFTDQDILRCIP